ncbi:MAG: hypothetical protein MI744_09995 [Pseudomonadales bacterium]|nr:hypothetical protein [Pseudomonadales bacterium]
MSTHKTEQLKWLYGGFAGICLAFFLTILGTGQSIDASVSLFLSTMGFGVCFPVFTVFTLVHVMFLEERRPAAEVDEALSPKWIQLLTQLSVLVFCFSIVLMLFHISVALGVICLVSTILILFAFKKFRSSLRDMP